jgi:hypothetical protein
MIDQNQILWDEKNLTELQSSCKNKNEQETSDITKNIKTSSTPNDWRNITDPKLRKKMRNKVWYEANKHKAKKRHEELKNDQEIQNKIKERRKKYYSENRELIRERQKIAYKKHYEANKEKIQAAHGDYNELNKDKIKKQRQEYYQRNKSKILDYNKSWRETNKDNLKEKQKIYGKEYYEANKEKQFKYQKNRKKTDIQFKLSCAIRSRLYTSIKDKCKVGSAVKDLGCSVDELIIYLESKFQEGMSWDNWKHDGWHIDHIKPLASFDLTDRNQFLEACNYTNLQPLWAKDNFSKGDSYPFLLV